MSTMIRKILLLSLALVLPFALLGCAEEEETLTSEQIDQIVIGAANAVAEAQTYKFDMDMFMTMAVVGGTDPGTMTVGANATGVIDSVNQEMETIMDMVMSVAEEDEQQMGMEMYVVDEWLYMKMSIPEIGEEWVKMELTPAMWQTQQQIEQTMDLLQSATEVKFLGSEAVDGVQCYVFDIIPDMEELAEYLGQQQSMLGVGLDIESLAELFANMSVSIREWVAQDSLFLTKSTADFLIEVTPADVGAAPEDFDKMTMDLSTVMMVYGYNQPVSIELPAEALEALEI
jgi:hypothetical protein